MSRIIYVNGKYQPYNQAMLHVEDRATLFADSVYEVIEIKSGQFVDRDAHLLRLERSMKEIRIKSPVTKSSLDIILSETIRRNRVHDGVLYLQISRGIAKRDFIFPDPEKTKPSLIVFTRSKNQKNMNEKAKLGIRVITMPDIRWQRPDIKTTGLLASVLARQSAIESRAEEAWLIDEENYITEGAASNAWIVTRENELITRQADQSILKGVTREGVIRLLSELKLTYQERKFTREEALKASECFITAATNLVMPVTHIDDQAINNAIPGPISLKLRAHFHEFAQLTR